MISLGLDCSSMVGWVRTLAAEVGSRLLHHLTNIPWPHRGIRCTCTVPGLNRKLTRRKAVA